MFTLTTRTTSRTPGPLVQESRTTGRGPGPEREAVERDEVERNSRYLSRSITVQTEPEEVCPAETLFLPLPPHSVELTGRITQSAAGSHRPPVRGKAVSPVLRFDRRPC